MQCLYEEKWTVDNYSYFTLRLHRYFQVEKSKDLLTHDASIKNIDADQLSNAISPPSWFLNVVTSTFASHSLNARNVINWKRNI